MHFFPELNVQLSEVSRAAGTGWLLVMGLMNNSKEALGAGDDSADQGWGKEPTSPHPKHLIHSLMSGA